MTARTKKIGDLPASTTLANSDLIIIEKVTNSISSSTTSMNIVNFKKGLMKGPYANDSVANTNGIVVGEMYYDVSGTVKVRLL